MACAAPAGAASAFFGGLLPMSTLQRVLVDDTGLTTAEYTIGTVAACGLGGVLVKTLTSPDILGLILRVITTAISAFL